MLRSKLSEHVAICTFPRHGIGIHPSDASRREKLPDSLLHPLRADSHMLNSRIAAFRTMTGRLGSIPAEMASQPILGSMQREGETAIGTATDMTALLAKQRCRESTAIEKQDGLLPQLQAFTDSHLQRCGKTTLGF